MQYLSISSSAAAAAAGHTTVTARVAGIYFRPIQMSQRRSMTHLANINEMRVSGSTTATRCCSCLLLKPVSTINQYRSTQFGQHFNYFTFDFT